MSGIITRQNLISHQQLIGTIPPTIAAAYQMKVYDHLVNVNCAGAFTITLPPVSECGGGFYVIKGVAGGTSTVTIVDKGDASVAISDTINAEDEVAMFYCDGQTWHFIITPPA